MNVNDDSVLVKYKKSGLSDAAIASKLGLTIEEVQLRWQHIQASVNAASSAGHEALLCQFSILCHQYQLLGESLKIVAGALSNGMTPSEVKKLVTEDPEQTIKNLFASSIILRPFVPVNPEDSLKEHLARLQKGN